MRNILKTGLLMACNAASFLWRSETTPAILMYHSFDETSWKHGVHPKELAKQLKLLQKKRTIVSLKELVAWVNGEVELPRDAVAITIDDGYADTCSVFFAHAKEQQIPFTLFLTTDLRSMSKLGDLKRPTVAELKEMHDSGLMTLGLHGHSHTNFPDALESGTLEQEVEASEQFFKEHFNTTVSAVAYPAGRTSESVFSYFKKRNYTTGCTTHPGQVRKESDPLRLPRIGVDRNTNLSLFSGRLSPGFAWYLKLVRSVT